MWSCICERSDAFFASGVFAGTTTLRGSGCRNVPSFAASIVLASFQCMTSVSSRIEPPRYMVTGVLSSIAARNGVRLLCFASVSEVRKAMTLSCRLGIFEGSWPGSGISSTVSMLSETSPTITSFEKVVDSSKVWQPGSKKTSSRMP